MLKKGEEMKRFILSMTMAISLLSAVAYAGDMALPHISVFGTAVTRIIPDKMIWHLQVRNKSSSLDSVAKEHIDIIKKVTAFLKESSVKDDEVQTSRMEFGENWEYKDRSRVKEGYYAITHVTFTMTDFNSYERIWKGLSLIENTSVNEILYDHTERIKHQNETRVKALIAAKEKAQLLAKTIGSEIAEPLLIEEISLSNDVENRPNVLQARREAFAEGDEGTPISPGLIPVRMRVKATFRLITHN